jgi:hypothetical protein
MCDRHAPEYPTFSVQSKSINPTSPELENITMSAWPLHTQLN